MQNLGLKDTIISDHHFQDAVDLISTFGYYQIIDKPDEIRSNQTFSVAIDAPVYRITDEQNYPYKDEEVLGNPYGMWRLTRRELQEII